MKEIHACTLMYAVQYMYITRAHYKNVTFLLYWLYWDGIATEEEIALSTVEVTCGEQASNSTVHIYSQKHSHTQHTRAICTNAQGYLPNYSSQGYIVGSLDDSLCSTNGHYILFSKHTSCVYIYILTSLSLW